MPVRQGGLVPDRARQFFFAHTQYAGAFLLWPQVQSWLATARECFSDDYGSLERGFLTSVFALVVGLERVFHLDQMQDVGFALLTGDARRCPSRYDVGAWRRHVLWNEVDRFCHRTSPWELLHGQDVLMSFDEHSIPRWTKKFVIPKGYVTTRNKFMRCEKLYLGYEVNLRRFATIKATPGNVELRDVAGLLTRRVLRYGQPASLHALFDAGAGKSDADVRALMDQAAATENLEVTLRACRYPGRVGAMEEFAGRGVHHLRGTRRLQGGSAEGDSRRRNPDGAQGRKRGGCRSHDRLPTGDPRAKEGPLAPAVHQQ